MEVLMAEFMIFGGLPEVVLLETQRQKIELLNDIISSYVIKDIRHVLQIEKLQELNKLLRMLAFGIGKEANISELSRNAGLHRESTQKYLMALEESFIISSISPFYTNPDKELRKMPKIYFTDTGLRNMLVNDFSTLGNRIDKGELVENMFYLSLLQSRTLSTKIHYWKTRQGREVDFVLKSPDKIIVYEVKYGAQNRDHFNAFRNAYPQASFFTVRYHYEPKSGELPLWFRPEP